MKRIILILLIVFMSQSTKETETLEVEYWQIGRFTLIKDTEGYYAITGVTISLHYDRAIKAIKEIE